MLEHLTEQPADKILMLMQAFRDDPRDTKIDLGVGVYKNADGVTPVMKAVKAAEKKIWEDQESKSYTSLAGEPLYIEGMIKLVLDGAVDRSRIGAVTTPGGTGAIRQAMELIKKTSPQAIVNMFQRWYGRLGLIGCSSHSGRRTFITETSKKISTVGGSLRDIQMMVGHSSLQTTQRYIESDSESQKKVVNLL